MSSPAFVRHLPEELQVMPFSLRIMSLIGVWGSRDRFYRFCIIFSYGIIIVLFPKAVLGIGSSDYGAIAKGIGEFLFEFVIFAFMVIFVTKRRHFEAMIYELTDMFKKVTFREQTRNCTEIIIKQNIQLKKFYNISVMYCGYAAIAYCLPSFCISHWRYWTSKYYNCSNPLIFDLPMEQEFYGLQIRTNFLHYHIFLLLSLLSYCTSSSFTFVKTTTPLFMMKYNTLAYRLVAAKIRELPNHLAESKQSEISKSDLIEVVQLHRQAYKVTNLIENICQIPMALQFLTCILFWCLTMFYASTNVNFNLFNVALAFFLSLLETAGYAYLGSELIEAADSVGAAIYDLPWYEDSVEMQRFYRLMIQRTQQRTCVTGVRFFVVELTSFSKVMNMSYSYYLILKDVLNKL
ncbi:uncharacterized protein LOC6035766 [Culex quinquefasciatus]|uniref:uncharacterized protein LOC6035766 n=1 Tax=Culex quinquefasciatus TaxID=7176 RepID=UPI0018E3AC8B|nr:uncharacterized protein LOC6035766 [Culex quinquefasciatus]